MIDTVLFMHRVCVEGGGEYSNIWARLGYVPADSVWFLNILILKKDIIFAHVGIVFLVRSLDI